MLLREGYYQVLASLTTACFAPEIVHIDPWGTGIAGVVL